MRKSYKMVVDSINKTIEAKVKVSNINGNFENEWLKYIVDILTLYEILEDIGECDNAFHETCKCIDRIWGNEV